VHFPVQNKIIVVTSDFKGIYLSASDRGALSRLRVTDPRLEMTKLPAGMEEPRPGSVGALGQE